jgi:hypothetical protein
MLVRRDFAQSVTCLEIDFGAGRPGTVRASEIASQVDLQAAFPQALRAASIALRRTRRLVKRKRKIKSWLVVDG